MKLRLTIVYEYSTGADDKETLNGYGTLDPAECAEVDLEGILCWSGPAEWAELTDLKVSSYRIEPVDD